MRAPLLLPRPNRAAPIAARGRNILGMLATCLFMVASWQAEEPLARRWQTAIAAENHAEVVHVAGELLEQPNPAAEVYYHRGRALFCLNRVEEAVEDFDRYVELRPEVASRQWERGIAYYYSGQWEKGAKQFELYQTYHDNDVENSVWRFLCLAPLIGVEEARHTMLPIRRDPRIPMMDIYDVFRGKATPLHVSLATFSDHPPIEQLDARTFYARLYMGLYYEVVEKDNDSAELLLGQAVEQYRNNQQINRFMWSVADVHVKRRGELARKQSEP